MLRISKMGAPYSGRRNGGSASACLPTPFSITITIFWFRNRPTGFSRRQCTGLMVLSLFGITFDTNCPATYGRDGTKNDWLRKMGSSCSASCTSISIRRVRGSPLKSSIGRSPAPRHMQKEQRIPYWIFCRSKSRITRSSFLQNGRKPRDCAQPFKTTKRPQPNSGYASSLSGPSFLTTVNWSAYSVTITNAMYKVRKSA